MSSLMPLPHQYSVSMPQSTPYMTFSTYTYIASICWYSQKAFVSEEQRSLGSLTPEPDSIRQCSDGCSMPYYYNSQFPFSLLWRDDVIPLIKQPPKYILSRLYFSAFIYLDKRNRLTLAKLLNGGQVRTQLLTQFDQCC